MRWSDSFAVGVALAAGFAGGFLVQGPSPGEPVRVTRTVGPTSEPSSLVHTRPALAHPAGMILDGGERKAGARREAEGRPSAIDERAGGERKAAPRLSPQQVARRALQWSASIRGDGVYGAGIVVDTRGYVLTNHHVVKGVEHLRVQFVDTEEMPAKVVATDKSLDLALLKVDATRPVAAPAGDFLTAEVGDDVFAVGCPRKMNFSVSRGMVSYVGRRIDGLYYLQSDLATNDGNSGGPVVNDRGEVIAVMTFILRDSQGLAFAVPIAYAYERFAEVLGADRLDLGRFRAWRQQQDDIATASR